MGRYQTRFGALSRREAIRWLGLGVAAVPAFREALWLSVSAAQAPAPGQPPTFPKGSVIRTLFKDIPPEQMPPGMILFHEHLSIELPQFGPRPADAPPPQSAPTTDVNLIVDEVKAAATSGVTCIVDGGHADMKRNLNNLKEIATRSGVLVVASGGYYMERVYPPDVAARSEDQVAEDLAREATANSYGAFGEIGENPDAPMSDLERKAFRAVGKAHLRTNLPIFTHNAYGTGPNVPKDAGLHQLDVLESVGVPPQHVVIGHTCCLDDPAADIIKQIARRGAFVGFDRVTGGRVPDEGKITMLRAFVDAGYVDHLLLSSDSTGGRTIDAPSYGRTTTGFVPKLLAAGFSQDLVHHVLVDNVRRFLAFVPKTAA